MFKKQFDPGPFLYTKHIRETTNWSHLFMLKPENSLSIPLNPKMSQILVNIAYQEGQSVIEWVEKILQEAIYKYALPKDKLLSEQLNALERIKQHRTEILVKRDNQPLNIDIASLLQDIREERDADFIANFNPTTYCH